MGSDLRTVGKNRRGVNIPNSMRPGEVHENFEFLAYYYEPFIALTTAESWVVFVYV